ncbi:Major_facilitator superfamily protein [Hexamita inflata]|uniref:Major_facilitator superfamily protein n=1 Tax=Hexamita inflata TaxID=28002 RepID=A0ABP1GJQ7_9EUKA
MKFQYQQTKPGHLVAVLGIPLLIQIMSSSHIIANSKTIQEQLKITQQLASWILNIETIVQLLLVTIVGKLGDKYGSTLILTTGVGIVALFNLMFVIPYFAQHYLAVMILRAGQSIGLGLAAPCVMPAVYQLVTKGKIQVVIGFASMLIPFGGIVSSFSAGFIAQSIGWQYMCFFIGIIAFVNFISCLVFLPMKHNQTKIVKFDFIGILLLGTGLVSFITGLLFISQTDDIPKFVKYIMVGVGLLFVVSFFIYDQKLSKHKIFDKNLMNKSVIITESILFLITMVSYGERYLVPYNMHANLHISSGQIGVCMAITGLSVLIFSPLMSVLYSKIVTKRIIIFAILFYLVFQFINAVQISWFKNLYVHVSLNFLTMGVYIGLIVVLQSFNFAQCPQSYSQQIGVLNQLIAMLGNSIGITSAVVMQQIFQKALKMQKLAPKSISYTDFVYSGLLLTAFVLCFFFGTLKSENGKKGYSEEAVKKTKGFKDETVGDLLTPEVFDEKESKREEVVATAETLDNLE